MTVKAEKIAALPGKPFTHGRSAELYDLGDGKVLKLYFPEFPESDVDLEYNNTRIAFALGCTPMECYAKAECEGRFGVILKKVAGISMTKMPEKNPLILFKAGRLIAEQHTMVQSRHSDDLPDLREKAAANLDTPQFALSSLCPRATASCTTTSTPRTSLWTARSASSSTG